MVRIPNSISLISSLILNCRQRSTETAQPETTIVGDLVLAWENHVIERSLGRAGRTARGHSICSGPAAARSRSIAHSFSFPPPTTSTELTKSSLSDDCSTPSQSQRVLPHTVVTYITHKHSLVTLGTCSATEFSRPPAQQAGSHPVSRPGQKAPSAFPTL